MAQDQRLCPNGHPVPGDADRFCETCGATLLCPNGHPVEGGSRFCEVCGVPLQPAAGAPGVAPRRSLSLPLLAAAGGGVALLVAIAGGAFLAFAGGDDGSPAPAGPTPDDAPASPTTPGQAPCLRLSVSIDFNGVPAREAEVSRSPSSGAGCPEGEYREGDAVTLTAAAFPGLHHVWGSSPAVIAEQFLSPVTVTMPAEHIFVSVIYYEGEAPAGGTPAPAPSATPTPAAAATPTIPPPSPTATRAAATPTSPPPAATATPTKPAPTSTPVPPAPTPTQPALGACWGLFINASFFPDADPEPPYSIIRAPLASDGCPAGQYRQGETVTLSASPVPGYHPVWGTSPDGLIPSAERHQATVVFTMPGRDVFAGPVYFED